MNEVSIRKNCESKALAFARQGIILALLSGILWSWNGLFVGMASEHTPFSNVAFWMLTPVMCAAINDSFAALLMTVYTIKRGQLPELRRSLVSKPGRFIILGAMIGAFFGMGCYMVALSLIGAAYVLPITSLYPAVAAVLAVIFLKERIKPLAWAGLAGCVIGAIVIGYTPPEGGGTLSNTFYLGLLFAFIASVGWGIEGVCATSGMDFIQPAIALNMYYLVSCFIYVFILLPLVLSGIIADQGGFSSLIIFFKSNGFKFMIMAGCVAPVAYLAWYKAMNMTGVSRAMALNVSYALWGILFSALFTDIVITKNLIIGAIVIFIGMVMVVGNPKDLINLRKVD